MALFLVLFDRDRHDDVFDSQPPGTVTVAKRYDQLVREIHDVEPVSMHPVSYHNSEGMRDIFMVGIHFDGDIPAMAAWLQDIYDNVGVAGWFEIVCELQVLPPAYTFK